MHPDAESDAVAEALARYAPIIWEIGRNAGVRDALREHGPSDGPGALLWMVMTPRIEENPYEGVPFEFEAHDDIRDTPPAESITLSSYEPGATRDTPPGE